MNPVFQSSQILLLFVDEQKLKAELQESDREKQRKSKSKREKEWERQRKREIVREMTCTEKERKTEVRGGSQERRGERNK